jgi:hypothetical protein
MPLKVNLYSLNPSDQPPLPPLPVRVGLGARLRALREAALRDEAGLAVDGVLLQGGRRLAKDHLAGEVLGAWLECGVCCVEWCVAGENGVRLHWSSGFLSD